MVLLALCPSELHKTSFEPKAGILAALLEVIHVLSHLAEKTSKFGRNELVGYVVFIGISSTINP